MLKRFVTCLSVLLLLLSAASSSRAIKETYMVAMRDSVRLATDVYRPDDSLSRPVLLYRTPYWRFLDHPDGNYWNNRGYVVVAQDVRGRFGSEGVDSVFLDDGWGLRQDGYDTIEWIANQSWCNGKVGMYGASARGITTYRAAGSLHANLLCCIPIVACSDFFHQVVFPGGEFRKALCEGWLQVEGAEYMIPFFLGRPYYEEVWELMNLHTRTDSMTMPILHVGGWYDCFSDGIVAAFVDLAARPLAGSQRLVMGPWVHSTVGSDAQVGELNYPGASFDLNGYGALWFDHWLLGDTNGIENEPNVRYYLMGDPLGGTEIGCEWIEASVWPPEDVVETAYFLDGNGALKLWVPSQSDTLSYAYDPRAPVPTLGGNNLMIASGPYDQRAIGQRTDVLEFTTEVLAAPLRVEGIVRAELYVSSDRRDTDFTLKLMDVYPDGREMLVTDGIQRARYRFGDREEDIALIEPGEVFSITVSIPPTAIVFNSGHRVKVAISSSNYPRYEINPNTEDPPYQQIDTLVAANLVYVGPDHPSAVILPVVPESPHVWEFQDRTEASPLLSAYPNPFRSHVRVSYRLPSDASVRLEVYDSLGRLVRTLVDTPERRGGHTAVWDGRESNGRQAAPAVYFVRLDLSSGSCQTAKVLLLR